MNYRANTIQINFSPISTSLNATTSTIVFISTTTSTSTASNVDTSSTTISTTTSTDCTPYPTSDTRPFFEREPLQQNLPRRISNISDQDLSEQLHLLRLIVLSTARNIEKNIDRFRKHIEPIVDLFHPTSRILICESDSDDKTIDKLYEWPRAQVYRYNKLSNLYPDRTDRLAFCRNKLLNISQEITADYIFVVDSDIFATNVSSFLTNFRYNSNDWSVMTASSSYYYDIWALRTLSNSVLNFDIWHKIWDIQQNNKSYCSESVLVEFITNHQKSIPIERGLIEVRSGFNGAALYKFNVTRECDYSGANKTCEHVPFHLCIRDKNQGRIFINPEFILDLFA